MTKEEVLKLRVINQAIDGLLTTKEAAQALNLSTRHGLSTGSNPSGRYRNGGRLQLKWHPGACLTL